MLAPMNRSGDDAILAALAGLLDRSHLAAPDALPDVVLACGRDLDWTVVIYLVDYEQRRLVPLVPSGTSDHVPEDIDSTLAGRSFRHVETVANAEGTRLWVPLLD